MAVGFVRSFHDDEGFGFIDDDEGHRFFVHHSAIVMDGFRTLRRGEKVIFDIGTEKRGPEAVNVRKV